MESSAAGSPPGPEIPPVRKGDVARRFLAFFVDSVIAWGAFWLLAWAFDAYAGYTLGAFVAGGYYLVRDGLGKGFLRGRSPGKTLVNLRVAHLDDTLPSISASIKRNWMFGAVFTGALPFLRTIGVLLALGALVVTCYEGYKVLTDTAGRRWGDELAGTKVVKSAA